MANNYRGKSHKFPLSGYQKSIVDNFLNWKSGHNIVVNALAGTGKTSTIECLGSHVNERFPVLYCAFNRHNADEARVKLSHLPMQVRTIHSVGMGGLRYAAQKAGHRITSRYVDSSKYHRYCKEALELAVNDGIVKRWDWKENETCAGILPISDKAREALEEEWPLSEVKRIVNLCRSKLVSFDKLNGEGEQVLLDLCWEFGLEIPEAAVTEILWIVLNAMNRGRASLFHTIDYTDMVWGVSALNLRLYQFPWVLVDECQDLSEAQLGVVMRAVWQKNGRLLFVGDRHQAIYGFAGAGTDSVDRIVEMTRGRELPLSTSWRCPVSHLELAQQIVPEIEPAPNAIQGVIEDVKYSALSKTVTDGDIVLCRRTAPLISLCFSLIAEGIAAQVRGRNIGEQIANLMEKVSPKRGFSFDSFPSYVSKWQNKAINKALRRTDGDEDDPAVQAIKDQADAMVAFWELSEATTLQGLQSEVMSVFAEDSDSPSVWLSTVHRAKGLESDRVFILDYEHIRMRTRTDWQAEQEANLEYIALTRSKHSLFFIEDDRD
jgi:superfamily I DNA/RNA helicase